MYRCGEIISDRVFHKVEKYKQEPDIAFKHNIEVIPNVTPNFFCHKCYTKFFLS